MISLKKSNECINLIDNTISNLNSIQERYEYALSCLSKGESAEKETTSRSLNKVIDDILSLKKQLNDISSTIETKSKEIYNQEQIDEQKQRLLEEAKNNE